MSGADRSPRLLVGVELGGTKTVVVLGGGAEIVERHRFPTAGPNETLPPVIAKLRQWALEHRPAALGIASFGPLGLNPAAATYGEIFATTKPGWRGTNLIAALGGLIDGPIGLSTDVIAAAQAEGEYGATQGCRGHAFVTVGTGIGVGVVVHGQPVTGRLHPEAGHMRVARVPGDAFEGVCAYHGDCLEGLASGPAIGKRAGQAGEAAGDDDPAWRFVIDALAQGCANLLLTLASERIVLGGGVIVARRWLVPAIEARMVELLGGYLPYVGEAPVLRSAALGDDAGPLGALLLARDALGAQ